MMTTITVIAGLLPIIWSTYTGSEVMRRIAAPMVGGMVSSTILALIDGRAPTLGAHYKNVIHPSAWRRYGSPRLKADAY